MSEGEASLIDVIQKSVVKLALIRWSFEGGKIGSPHANWRRNKG